MVTFHLIVAIRYLLRLPAEFRGIEQMGTLTQRVRGLNARHRAITSREFVPWIACVVFYVIIANIPYWFASRELDFVQMGLFCAQYAAAGILSLFLPQFIIAPLLFLLICSDILCGICMSYCISLYECLANLHAVSSYSFDHHLLAVSILVLALFTAAASTQVPGRWLSRSQRWKAALCLGAFAVLILGTDAISLRIAKGHIPFLSRAISGPGESSTDSLAMAHFRALRFARIPIIRLVRFERIEAAIRAREERDKGSHAPVPSASAAALAASGIFSSQPRQVQPNVVLVVVESWGLAEDLPLRQAFVQPYLQPDVQSRYQVSQGTAPFYGTTIAGEARELCHSSIGFYIIKAPSSDLQTCLPDRFAALGYRTVGLHGMRGHMFNRKLWYHTIGFQESWFYGRFKDTGLRECIGAFVGICDGDIAAWIGHRLDNDASQPYFIHWMTLNSHLPTPVPPPISNAVPCDPSLSIEPGTPACSWYQLVENVHRSVAQVATGALARPTVFVIVGDHAPPFGESKIRARFSQTDVPYVILVPRSLGASSKTQLTQNTAVPSTLAALAP